MASIPSAVRRASLAAQIVEAAPPLDDEDEDLADLSGLAWLYRAPPLVEGYSAKLRIPDDHLDRVSKSEKSLGGKAKNMLTLREPKKTKRGAAIAMDLMAIEVLGKEFCRSEPITSEEAEKSLVKLRVPHADEVIIAMGGVPPPRPVKEQVAEVPPPPAAAEAADADGDGEQSAAAAKPRPAKKARISSASAGPAAYPSSPAPSSSSSSSSAAAAPPASAPPKSLAAAQKAQPPGGALLAARVDAACEGIAHVLEALTPFLSQNVPGFEMPTHVSELEELRGAYFAHADAAAAAGSPDTASSKREWVVGAFEVARTLLVGLEGLRRGDLASFYASMATVPLRAAAGSTRSQHDQRSFLSLSSTPQWMEVKVASAALPSVLIVDRAAMALTAALNPGSSPAALRASLKALAQAGPLSPPPIFSSKAAASSSVANGAAPDSFYPLRTSKEDTTAVEDMAAAVELMAQALPPEAAGGLPRVPVTPETAKRSSLVLVALQVALDAEQALVHYNYSAACVAPRAGGGGAAAGGAGQAKEAPAAASERAALAERLAGLAARVRGMQASLAAQY